MLTKIFSKLHINLTDIYKYKKKKETDLLTSSKEQDTLIVDEALH